MKKLLALALTLVMVLGTISFGYAAEPVGVNVDLTGESSVKVGLDDANYASQYNYDNWDYDTTYFDLKAELDMEKVSEQLETLAEIDIEKAVTADVVGSFNFTVTFPNNVTVNPDFYNNLTFDDGNGTFENFYVIPSEGSVSENNNVYTFTVDLKAGLKGSDLFTNVGGQAISKLGSAITVTCEDAVVANTTGVHEITVAVTGSTQIKKVDDTKYDITYHFGTIPNAIINITYTDGGGSGGGGGSRPNYVIPGTTPKPVTPSETPSYKVEYVVGTGTETGAELKDATVDKDSKVILPETAGTREGFVFDGWYANGKAVSGEIVITEDTVITAKWINTKPAEGLNADNHIVYIQGYPDGTVKPNDNISRDEVATIFYRLLAEDKKAEIEVKESDFDDVKGHWAEIAIATLKNGGYINGYEDGTFKPTASITRAEFVTIAAKFASATADLKNSYSDIDGHWAEEAIKLASDLGWITGYENGTFKPDATITRAEVVTIVNRMLVRYYDHESYEGEVKIFPDNNVGDWYYHGIVEATNKHDHERRENGYSEDWTGLNESEKFEF